MPPPNAVLELVERFEHNREAYRSGHYNETQVRREFIDPFFEALGWDVANRQGYAEAYKDVVHEETLRVGGGTKAPDYGFRVGGQRKFFVEAKKPSVDIKGDVHPAYQLRRYAWSAKLPLSVLTDFEEFAAYDCRVRPDKSDKASTARVLYVTVNQFSQRWDEIAGVFSREAILRGSFDKYAEGTASKRGTAEVDRAFLAEIERWRDLLARSIALRNAGLSQRQLNFAVQQTIDRIIFLRICEDRGIEPYGTLLGLVNGAQVYERLLLRFRHADARYNSGLFYFDPDRTRVDAPDTLTARIAIDDRPLRDILKNLYYPDSPYEFSVLPADILGQVYEQFLGKVIRLVPHGQTKRAVVEEKPEVRKAGGVFYTPTFIVATIVRETLGRLLAGLSVRQVMGLATRAGRQAFPVRVADIACGSGSFLLGAYQSLLDWYLAAYLADGAQKWATGRTPRLYQSARGDWRLTITERKRILLDHIYGVDIDPQAVEVTKLSLLLKVLEGEDEQTMGQQLALFPERALPDLGRNIKCGNSLIGPDFYEGQQMALLDDETVQRVNVFDWPAEFPQVWPPSPPGRGDGGEGGGFDVIIGNPPYVLLQSLGVPAVDTYLRSHYQSAVYKVDTYQVFLEQAIRLTSEGGFTGFIVPNTFLRNKYALELRRSLLNQTSIKEIVLFHYSVFPKASVDTAIVITRKQKSPYPDDRVRFVSSHEMGVFEEFGETEQMLWQLNDDLGFDLPRNQTIVSIMSRIEGLSTPLGEFATAYFGIQTHGRSEYVRSATGGAEWKPIVDGGDINRYSLSSPKEYVFFAPEAIKSGGKQAVYEQPRIGVRQIGRRPIATILPAGCYSLNTIYNIYFTKEVEYSLYFVLGLVSSKLFGWYWEQRFFDQKVTFPKIKKAPLLSLPIRTIDFTDPVDVARHDRMVSLVERMLDLHKRVAAEQVPHAKNMLQRQIEATDRQIDALVYELYGLTEAEVAVVEGVEGAIHE